MSFFRIKLHKGRISIDFDSKDKIKETIQNVNYLVFGETKK